MRLLPTAAAATAALLAPAAAPAEPTPIEIRVLSEGAKFIGSSMGGVQVALLAEGRTEGGTGDTARIMGAQPRGATLSTEGAAVFAAEIDVDRPIRVEVEATGPLAQRQAANTVTATRWVLPGVGLAGGDGWLLQMPGMAVDVLAPAAGAEAPAPRDSIRVEANVAMMCGCPLAPEGVPWDSDAVRVVAHVVHDGTPAGETRLTYAGEASRFAAEVPTGGPGLYEIVVTAHEVATGNAGVDSATISIPAAGDG